MALYGLFVVEAGPLSYVATSTAFVYRQSRPGVYGQPILLAINTAGCF